MHDPSDPRQPKRRQQPRQLPRDYVPAPPGFNASMGTPRDDTRVWWRLQPGERGPDGSWIRRGIVHGGTCSRWPTGRAPADWTYHNRAQAKAMLDQPQDYIPCPTCCVGWLWAIRPRQGLGPRDWPTAER